MATDFLSLLTAIPNLMQAFGGGTTAPFGSQQQQIAKQQQNISNALTNTNNPLYQQLYGQYHQQGANNLAQGIAELQGQNRANLQNGRTPLFSQDRGGEQVFRNLMQGYQNLGVQSDQQTRGALYDAGGQNMGAAAIYNQISPYAARANSAQLGGFQNIYDLLGGGKGTNQGYQTTSSYNGSPMASFPNPINQPFVQQSSPYGMSYGGQSGSMGAGNYSQNNFVPQVQPFSGMSY